MFIEKEIGFGNDLVMQFRARQCDRDVWLDFYPDRIVLNIGSEQVTFKPGSASGQQIIAVNGDRK